MTINTLILMKELLENEEKTRAAAYREAHKVTMDAMEAEEWSRVETLQQIERTQWDRLDAAREALHELKNQDWR